MNTGRNTVVILFCTDADVLALLSHTVSQYLCICVTQCSASCGVGYQQRIVSCSVTPPSHAAAQSTSGSTRCHKPHPPGTQPCLLTDCPHTTYWKVGPWSKVKQNTSSPVKNPLKLITKYAKPLQDLDIVQL